MDHQYSKTFRWVATFVFVWALGVEMGCRYIIYAYDPTTALDNAKFFATSSYYTGCISGVFEKTGQKDDPNCRKLADIHSKNISTIIDQELYKKDE